jgi:hypothetical protein
VDRLKGYAPLSDLGRGGGRKEGEVRWAAGGLGRFVFFFFSSFSFQIHFKINFKPFKFKSFTCFQTQILTQILQLFKGFSQNNFSNIF